MKRHVKKKLSPRHLPEATFIGSLPLLRRELPPASQVLQLFFSPRAPRSLWFLWESGELQFQILATGLPT